MENAIIEQAEARKREIIEILARAEAQAQGEVFECYEADYLEDAEIVYNILREKGIL